MLIFQALCGILLIIAGGYIFSENRRKIHWKTVVAGIFLQISIAALILKGSWIASFLHFFSMPLYTALWILAIQAFFLLLMVRFASRWSEISLSWFKRIFWIELFFVAVRFNLIESFFDSIKMGAMKLRDYSTVGAEFVYGILGSKSSMDAALVYHQDGLEKVKSVGFIFAFQVLPTIIFVASLFAILYHLGIMQIMIRAIASVIHKIMKASGAETLSVAANIFMGQTEAPLTIKPYLSKLTRSELFTIMVSGMAHCSAAILVVYTAVSGADARHLLTSVIMTAPGAIMLSKMMIPEIENPTTGSETTQATLVAYDQPVNVIDAAARGASDGLNLAANVGAMLIAFIALMALADGLYATLREWLIALSASSFSWLPGTIKEGFGWLMSPIVFLTGIPWSESHAVGNLLGTKLVLNEFVAYVDLGSLMKNTSTMLSQKSFMISTYILCGFGSFASIAIQTGGIGALIPERRKELAALGLKAVMVGVLSNLLAASIAGILY